MTYKIQPAHRAQPRRTMNSRSIARYVPCAPQHNYRSPWEAYHLVRVVRPVIVGDKRGAVLFYEVMHCNQQGESFSEQKFLVPWQQLVWASRVPAGAGSRQVPRASDRNPTSDAL